MANERPVCVYAMAALQRNSTRLMIMMCVGVALALCGVYIQTRMQSNPNYTPTIAVATKWFYAILGRRLVNSSRLLRGCTNELSDSFKPTVGKLLMHRFIYPITRYSGLMNGTINLVQIILLKVYCKSFTGTHSIIALSALGAGISLLCLIGSFVACKMMCLSCLGIHHGAIIYLAMNRCRILKNVLCPTENVNASGCTFGPGNSTSSSNSITAIRANSNDSATTAIRHSSSCTTRLRKDNNGEMKRRRSDRI